MMALLALPLHATLSEGDTVRVTITGIPVTQQKQINGLYKISADGLHLPLLGTTIKVIGLETKDAADAAEKAYRSAGVFKDPEIDLFVERGGDRTPAKPTE